MLQYIYRDLIGVGRYLPYGLALGIPVACVCVWAAWKARRQGKKSPAAVPLTCFCIYAAVVLVITFLSREVGSRNGLDLRLFATWGINARNNAFVVENVLLFIPYGFLSCWTFERMRKFWPCTALGAVTSLGIECLQLMTGRGYFQTDDVLTNILGTILGFLVFRLLRGK